MPNFIQSLLSRKGRNLKKAQNLILSGREGSACEILSKLNGEYADDSEIMLWLAIAYSQGHKYSDALKLIERTLEISPGDTIAGLVKGEILINLGDYDGAIKVLADSLEKNSDNTRIAYLLGLAWLKKGEIDKASTFFESAIKYDRDLVESRLLAMAELYLHKNR